jgi:hypothetical protein
MQDKSLQTALAVNHIPTIHNSIVYFLLLHSLIHSLSLFCSFFFYLTALQTCRHIERTMHCYAQCTRKLKKKHYNDGNDKTRHKCALQKKSFRDAIVSIHNEYSQQQNKIPNISYSLIRLNIVVFFLIFHLFMFKFVID